METWVQSEGFHHYVIIGTEAADIDSFACKMLMRYEGAGLLPFEFRCQNGSVRISYDIRGFASLEEYFSTREMESRELRALFRAVWDCYEELEDHLLPMEGFLLSPKWIYYQPGKKEFHFCYCPGGLSVFQKEFSALVEFCMRRARHQDAEGVLFIYGLYRLLQEEGMEGGMLQRYLAEWEMPERAEEEETPGAAEETGHERILEEEQKERKTDEIRKSREVPAGIKAGQGIAFYLYAVLSASALCAILIFGIRFLMLTHRESDLKICIILAVILLFCLYSMIQSRRRPPLAGMNGGDARSPSPMLVEEEQSGQEHVLPALAEETMVLQMEKAAGDEVVDPILWILESRTADNKNIVLRYLPGVLGRDGTDVDYVVLDEGISRRHLLLFLSGEELYAEDLASTNGTYINGRRLEAGEPVRLCEGDHLSAASSRYRVQRRKSQLEEQA